MATIDQHVSSPMKSTSAFNAVDWIALALMIIGAINWGLVGAFGFNLVSALFGEMTTISRIVYVLVGLAGLYGLSMPARLRRLP